MLEEVIRSQVGMGVDEARKSETFLPEDVASHSVGLGPTTVDHVTRDSPTEGRPENKPSTHESDANCRQVHIMNKMRKALLLVLVTVVACAPASTENSTTTLPAQTAVTTPPHPTTTTVPLEIQGCASPPVTFSALCEVYDLLQEWHVDRPLSAADLAGVATRALANVASTDFEPKPRTFFCAVPHQDFSEFCDDLAGMVNDSSIAVGPTVDKTLQTMIDQTLGPFTYYLPPEQVGAFRSNGVVGGIGVLLDARDAAGSKCAVIGGACRLEVVFVLEDNPGAEAGLAAGDVILTVDGSSVEGNGFAAAATDIAGDETGTVELTIDRDGETLTYVIERAELTVPTVEVDLPRSDVGYIRIPDFEEDIPTLVRDGLETITDFSPQTIVVDLRDNPGGFVDVAVDIASEFIDGGPIFETFGRGEDFVYTATEGGLATGSRLIVLVNNGSASAAEVLAGALRDRRSAVLVGTNTFGKDAVQIPFTLRNGGELYVVVARWATPDGTTVGNGGLTPDRELDLAPGLTTEQVVDAALDAAS